MFPRKTESIMTTILNRHFLVNLSDINADEFSFFWGEF